MLRFFSVLLILVLIFTLSGCCKMKHEAEIKDSLYDMKIMAISKGAPNAIGDLLYFGYTGMHGNYEIVDAISAKYGCTATFFARVGDTFVRTSTSIMKDGKRAVGTILDPAGPVIVNILKREPFYGMVDILGKMYETGYEPIIDTMGEVIGIYYTGFELEE